MTSDALSTSTRLALLSPVRETSIEHIARQLENYRVFLAPFQLRHYLYISLDSSSTLKANLLAFTEAEGHDIGLPISQDLPGVLTQLMPSVN
jgi:hypothetical protein